MKSILIAGHDPYGLLDGLQEGIHKYTDFTYDFLNYDSYSRTFSYKCFGQRVQNFFLKNFTARNLKKDHLDNELTLAIDQLKPSYDMILILRPDYIMDHHLERLRKKTKHFVAYFWDAIKFYPRKLFIKEYFDRIFSFDPDDCEKYGFEFLANFYFYETLTTRHDYKVYNLSMFDNRKTLIEKIGSQLRKMDVSFCFRGISPKGFNSDFIQRSTKVSYKEVLQQTASSEIVLDIHKPGQQGLGLRPFEALGLNKKLITTNGAIVNYDFYNPNNILVLDSENVSIRESFFNTAYEPVATGLKEKYHLKNWLYTVLA